MDNEEPVDSYLLSRIIGDVICKHASSWNKWRVLGGFGIKGKVGAIYVCD